jgi:hypothetical protein
MKSRGLPVVGSHDGSDERRQNKSGEYNPIITVTVPQNSSVLRRTQVLYRLYKTIVACYFLDLKFSRQ